MEASNKYNNMEENPFGTVKIKAFRARKNAMLKELEEHKNPQLLLRKNTLTRTQKTRNLRSAVGRSQKSVDLHSLLRKEAITIATPAEQRQSVHGLMDKDSKRLGEEYCIISGIWWRNWKKYVGYDGSSGDLPAAPGVMDNTSLIDTIDSEDNFLRLRRDIKSEDYQIVPKKVYKKLCAWYGGGPKIVRKVVIIGMASQSLQIELFPVHLRVMKVDTEEIRIFDFPSTSSIKEVRRMVASSWSAPLVKCRLFLHEGELTCDQNIGKSIQELDLQDGQIILMRSSEHTFALSGKMIGISNHKEDTLVEKILGKPVEKVSYPAKVDTKTELVLYIPEIAKKQDFGRRYSEVELCPDEALSVTASTS